MSNKAVYAKFDPEDQDLLKDFLKSSSAFLMGDTLEAAERTGPVHVELRPSKGKRDACMQPALSLFGSVAWPIPKAPSKIDPATTAAAQQAESDRSHQLPQGRLSLTTRP